MPKRSWTSPGVSQNSACTNQITQGKPIVFDHGWPLSNDDWKAVLVSAVPPIMLKADKNPDGLPIEVFDDLRRRLAANRSQVYREFPMPFYGFTRPGAKSVEAVVDN